jgi:hypothetical protein
VDPETETVDLSTEQAFFARATVLSDHPVSFDTGAFEEESRWPTLDLEGREQRRAHFTRVVGAIIGTLGVGALLALARPAPRPAEAAPFAASSPVVAETAEIQAVEPTPTLLPELSVSAPEASSSSVGSAASSLGSPAPSAPAASVKRPHKRAPRAPVATPPTRVESDKRLPPTARFAD